MDTSDLIVLLHRSEGDTLDFKSQQYQFSGGTEEQKGELLKDVLALANAWKDGPAHLVIGVDEQHGNAVAFPGVTVHLPDHSLQQFVNAITNSPIRFQVETVAHAGVQLDIIQVAKQQARPLFLRRDYGRLKENVVYVRRGSSTAEAGPDEIAEMGRADAITGTPSVPNLVLEFAHPQERKRWGRAAEVTCTVLSDPPSFRPPPARPQRAIEQIMRTVAQPRAARPWAQATDIQIESKISPTCKEWIDYLKKSARFAGVSFWAQNVGTVNASNVRVEVRIPKRTDGLIVTSGHRKPRRPRGLMDIALGPLNTPSIGVHEEGEEFVMSLAVGTLQPKAEYWERGDFIVSATKTCELPTRVRIFADDLPNPLEATLTLKVRVDSRILTERDLAAIMADS